MFGLSTVKRQVTVVVIVLGIAGALFWIWDERWPAEVEVSEMAEKASEPEGRNSEESGADDRVEARQADSGGLPLWRAIDERSVGRLPFFAEEWSPEGRALVRVTGAAAAAQDWQVGDRLTIPLPQFGEIYRPVIHEVDDGPGYSRAALGKVLHDDGYYRRILVTVGPTSTFAFIDTPEGSYELVADSDYGWLLPTASMMAGFDLSQPDYVLPEDGPRYRRP